MVNKSTDKIANKLVNAFLKNKIISPIPKKYTKKISNAQIFRKLCESKIKKPISGFKAAGTGIPVLKKLKEKEPFYATVYKHNVLKNKKSVKINKFTKENTQFTSYFFGHLGDGNLHCNFKVENELNKDINILSEFVYDLTLSLNGSIAAEHGLGQKKNMLLKKYKSKEYYDFLKNLKNYFKT